MKDLQEKEPLIEEIWNLLLSQFDVGASKEVQQSVIKFSLQQARALQFLRTKQQNDAHLQHFVQDIESCPECHYHPLKDFLESEMKHLTSYSLLLNNTIQHTDGLSDGDVQP